MDPSDPPLTPERHKQLWELADQLIAGEAAFKALLKVKIERQAIRDFIIGLGAARQT
ncbi:MAG: hypothetical protein KGM18_14530 [Sphingomonadales bacterium]|nr:hypothetical protein [Sphingomonadales bacterium]